jgi:hypothetical protein
MAHIQPCRCNCMDHCACSDNMSSLCHQYHRINGSTPSTLQDLSMPMIRYTPGAAAMAAVGAAAGSKRSLCVRYTLHNPPSTPRYRSISYTHRVLEQVLSSNWAPCRRWWLLCQGLWYGRKVHTRSSAGRTLAFARREAYPGGRFLSGFMPIDNQCTDVVK